MRAVETVIDKHLDLKGVASRYCNDETGRLAYDPKVLLKIVLFSHYKGVISSRKMAEAYQRNVKLIALTGDTLGPQHRENRPCKSGIVAIDRRTPYPPASSAGQD